MALVGDASGYVDALTGEGITLALAQSQRLVSLLAEDRLDRYPAEHFRVSLGYRLSTRALLALTRHKWIAEPTVALLARYPRLFELLLRLALPRV